MGHRCSLSPDKTPKDKNSMDTRQFRPPTKPKTTVLSEMLVGLNIGQVVSISELLRASRQRGYDFISVPIFKICPPDTPIENCEPCLSWNDVDLGLKYDDWSLLINTELYSWGFQNPSGRPYSIKRRNIMTRELDFACHLGIRLVSFRLDADSDIATISQILREFCENGKLAMHVMTIISMDFSSPDSDKSLLKILESFDDINMMTNHLINLSICLELSKPASILSEHAEPLLGRNVSCLRFSDNSFYRNNYDINVLNSKMKHTLIMLILMLNKNMKLLVDSSEMADVASFVNYLRHFENKLNQEYQLNAQQPYSGYDDWPQIPLQPLSKNLESCVYEVFEEDPVKYVEYERAMFNFLGERISSSPNQINILIVGAGRGPLVSCAYRCLKKLPPHPINLIAIEKNPNAIPTLQRKKIVEGWFNADIIETDIRYWTPSSDYKADLIVSELLGSFGDNELSPECLDAALRFLSPIGIFVPSSYTSYVAPVSAPVLYNQLCVLAPRMKENNLQSPCVADLKIHARLSSIKECFRFDHPHISESGLTTNERYSELTFDINKSGLIHGFAGYFSCNLYKDINLSINPDSFTPDLCSWFPFFIPMNNPIKVKKHEKVTFRIWRRVSSSSVWYEWAANTSHGSTIIHNSAGKHYSIGLN